MPVWQQDYNSDPDVQRLCRNFDNYKTVDWQFEKLQENRNYWNALKHRRSIGTRQNDEDIELTSDVENLRPVTQASLESLSSIISEISNLQLITSRIWSSFQIWFVLTIVGIVIGSIAAFLSVLTEYLNGIKNQLFKDIVILNFLTFTVLSISFGIFASFLCIYFAPNASGSGISEVKCIVSGFSRPDFLSVNTLIIKAFALPFTIASGLSVGKEGPSVHYASCVGNVVARFIVPWFNESPIQLSDVITASAGSGVAVAFGSPIGGVLFSVEEISSGLRLSTLWKTFYTSLIAITTLQIWNPFGTGQIVMFEVKYSSDWIWSEITWFIILGIFGGLYGIIISKWNIKYVSFRQKYLSNFKYSGVLEVFWLCLVSSIVGYWNIFMRMDMTEVMELLFDSCNNEESSSNFICSISKFKNNNEISTADWLFTLFTIFYATIIRMVLVCISYGSKVPCGIFVPSMAVGATFGKLLGLLVEEIFGGDGFTSGTYAFLGAGAALSGITGLTVTVVVIMYELTGAIKYIIPTMITVVSVRIVIELGGNGYGGIADQMIKFNGLPYIDLKEEHELGETVTVGEVMVPQIIGLDYDGMKLRDILKILEFEKVEYPILYKRKYVLGTISFKHLQEIVSNCDLNDNTFIRFLSRATISRLIKDEGSENAELDDDDGMREQNVFEEFVEFEYLSLDIETSIYTLFDLFIEIGVRVIYVYKDDQVVGIISRKDLIKYENYVHYKHNGNVFVNEYDDLLFNKLLKLYNRVWGFKKRIIDSACNRSGGDDA